MSRLSQFSSCSNAFLYGPAAVRSASISREIVSLIAADESGGNIGFLRSRDRHDWACRERAIGAADLTVSREEFRLNI